VFFAVQSLLCGEKELLQNAGLYEGVYVMQYYLLAWNPKRWIWEDLSELSEQVNAGNEVIIQWSCGVSKKLEKGDRVFLVRLGEEPKGIFASGIVVKGSFLDDHWDDEKASAGRKAYHVLVKFEKLLNPETDNILSRDILIASPLYSEMHWDTQMSGVRIPEDVAEKVDKIWGLFGASEEMTLPEEVDPTRSYSEGAVRSVFVNAYERSPQARKDCIAYYGTECQVCGFDFQKAYGEIGRGFIQVHHVVPMSEIGKKYEINPIVDLRPICPNCHAMIHRKKPSYSIGEIRQIINSSKHY
jgi:5-methylcytosine-specific restriction enzyme A